MIMAIIITPSTLSSLCIFSVFVACWDRALAALHYINRPLSRILLLFFQQLSKTLLPPKRHHGQDMTLLSKRKQEFYMCVLLAAPSFRFKTNARASYDCVGPFLEKSKIIWKIYSWLHLYSETPNLCRFCSCLVELPAECYQNFQGHLQ